MVPKEQIEEGSLGERELRQYVVGKAKRQHVLDGQHTSLRRLASTILAPEHPVEQTSLTQEESASLGNAAFRPVQFSSMPDNTRAGILGLSQENIPPEDYEGDVHER